uniref:Cytochrome P450 CYP82C1 n=1 Tax=Carthamus tinctorius var. tinctorius TaxID=311154 RepID=A0A5J6CZH4_CARTI|nr:cytochrome P450 CYP82C1 [Carthamus tinctorius var. tinctorius]
MADDYGPAFSLRLGSHRAFVVSNWQMVKECFTTNDRNFATRPNMAVSRYMGYNQAVFALAPYGPYWREIRKMVTLEMLTSQRLEKLKNFRNSEVKWFVNELFSLSASKNRDGKVEMMKRFENVMFNIIVRMLAGKRFSSGGSDESGNEDLRVKEAIKKGLYLSGVFVVSDVIPSLELMDIGGHLKAMKQAAKELDSILEKWLDEHVEKRTEYGGDKETDFMDVMLSKLSKDAEMFSYGRDTIIKATTLILILTGSESTAETLTWTLSLLLNTPRVLQAVQKELDIHVGREKWVEESDIKNLRYLQAVVKETLRMYPPGPLAGPREAIEDCNIGGYHISKGTRLIVNVWKLHRDPQVWSDPHEFRPERFLEEHSEVNYQGQNFEYIPFSSGRRMCPASTFALQVVHLTLARLLQGFDLSTPMGMPVDMSEGLGIALPKVKPLEVVIAPRLSSELYD